MQKLENSEKYNIPAVEMVLKVLLLIHTLCICTVGNVSAFHIPLVYIHVLRR